VTYKYTVCPLLSSTHPVVKSSQAFLYGTMCILFQLLGYSTIIFLWEVLASRTETVENKTYDTTYVVVVIVRHCERLYERRVRQIHYSSCEYIIAELLTLVGRIACRIAHFFSDESGKRVLIKIVIRFPKKLFIMMWNIH